MIPHEKVHPGDIVLTRGSGWTGFMIRLGAAILDRPNTINHVIVAHHVDQAGTFWGIEARPGGVGWVDMKEALRGSYNLSNYAQPKTDLQRAQICKVVESMLGTPYDWEGIALDAMEDLHIPALWASWDSEGRPPAHVVCSSLADWVYDKVGLKSPGLPFDRTCTPGDWARFIIERRWAMKSA